MEDQKYVAPMAEFVENYAKKSVDIGSEMELRRPKAVKVDYSTDARSASSTADFRRTSPMNGPARRRTARCQEKKPWIYDHRTI